MTTQPEIQFIPDWQWELTDYMIQPCNLACLCYPRPPDWRWWQAGTAEPLVEPADVWRPS